MEYDNDKDSKIEEFGLFTIEELESAVAQMNSGTMHEVDQLVMMCDTQRSIIKMLQEEIADLKSQLV